MIDFVQFFCGTLLIYFSAEFIIRYGKELAFLIGVPRYIIGLTLISFGTSFPELVVNLNASIINESSIVIGNIIGSNIANIALVLSFAIIISPIALKGVKANVLIYFLLSTAFLIAFCLDGNLNRLEGFILLFAFILFCFSIKREAKSEMLNRDNKNKFDYHIIVILACSFFMLIAGSDLFINSAINIADSLGVSKIAISLTMVAIGTSLPELATSIIAAIKKEHDLLIGNIIGSNIMNILMVLGTSILVNEINMLINYKALIVLLAVTIFIYIYSILKINFSRIIAFILLSIYLIFNYSIFINN